MTRTFSLLECMHVVEGVERSLVTHSRHRDSKTSFIQGKTFIELLNHNIQKTKYTIIKTLEAT